PIIAIIGKPNVGKSTIFNRIIQGQRQALVEEIPGTTRDRYYGEAFLYGREFILVDTGGLIGEPKDEGEKDQFQQVIHSQAEIAIEESDAILFVLDYKSGITPIDKELARMLRKKKQSLNGKPIYIAVNKADNVVQRSEGFEDLKVQVTRLGFGEPMPFSALHGDGVHSMFETILSKFPYMDLSNERIEQELGPGPIRISIVGKPNAGKSSLLNKIIDEQRSIVSDIPGTTHDPVDCNFLWRDKHELCLVDTAGIRRRSTHKVGLEKSSVLWALKSIEKSHVVFLVIDATVGITDQDLKIASFIMENRKSCIILVNKWDLYLKNKKTREELSDQLFFHNFQKQNTTNFVPVLFTSAKTGFCVPTAIDLSIKVFFEREKKLKISQLLQIIKEATFKHKFPKKGKNSLKLKYAIQTKHFPPTFLFWVNNPEDVDPSIVRYLLKSIREFYPFVGTPIYIKFRRNK
ncbi:hypothetical protein DICPUDRAFT_6420, partial [Dictyostelium purpureum]